MKARTFVIAGIGLAVLFWFALQLLRVYWGWESGLVVAGVELALIGGGSLIFWRWFSAKLAERDTEIQSRTQQLEALRKASMAVTSELELIDVLQMVVDLSRELVNARYGALGVLDEEGTHIQHFVTSGISPQERDQIGVPPQGRGLLGVMIRERRSLRVSRIQDDPRSAGFPAFHPPMHSLLGVPIVSRNRVFGNLYLTDKDAADVNAPRTLPTGFTPQDQETLELFAAQAAIAIENALLYRRNRQLAILQERERISMDLHDGIIQSAYAIGLQLEDIRHRLDQDRQTIEPSLKQAMQSLNEVIVDIRNYILDLRPGRFEGRSLRDGLEELVQELRSHTFLHVELEMDDSVAESLNPDQTVEILHVVREALANIRKHARAASVRIIVAEQGRQLDISVVDDGRGFEWGIGPGLGNGLHNMRERMRHLDGTFHINSAPGQGTRILLSMPLVTGPTATAPQSDGE